MLSALKITQTFEIITINLCILFDALFGHWGPPYTLM